MENIPKEGGLILCSNHAGELDMFFTGYKMKRLIHFMAKSELFENPFLRWFFTNIGAFPIKRGVADLGAARAVYKLLKTGNIVGIMPEGTRTKGKQKEDIKIKSGAVMFAYSAGVPILPVGVSSNHKLFSKVNVNYGMPFILESKTGRKPTSQELEEMSEELMSRIYSLVE